MGYKEETDQKYNEIFSKDYIVALGGRDSDNAKKSAERTAQHNAMLVTFTETYENYRQSVNAASIWNSIYSAHLRRKAGTFDSADLNEEIIEKVISGAQSWRKSSGHVFEHYVVESTKERLKKHDIQFVLQKELTSLIQDDMILNEPDDKIPEMAQSDNFDIYALVKVGSQKLVFGCVQAKTSIRDRVGRDRDFSIPAMERHFWSVAVVLDGEYLSMPKFNKMVNGGDTLQYVKNGWHGMYSLSNAENENRIYNDKNLDLLVDHAHQAAVKYMSARQRFDENWKAT